MKLNNYICNEIEKALSKDDYYVRIEYDYTRNIKGKPIRDNKLSVIIIKEYIEYDNIYCEYLHTNIKRKFYINKITINNINIDFNNNVRNTKIYSKKLNMKIQFFNDNVDIEITNMPIKTLAKLCTFSALGE